ncbi:DUF5610 domain-containing protein [Chromobacterium haemolyticum]|uniref:DUF5610 domain-containing protein n=1 Tax=Chromobacterium haemolyticum TaxID=394935 RepID=A0A1W0C8X5_9NEIS|nr:DUF5610 domain-containing protein [Chromobacterium haemolyticum]OQS31159.1 hypothetical protein B0T45_23220 [Chromobacterium haemolyticum]
MPILPVTLTQAGRSAGHSLSQQEHGGKHGRQREPAPASANPVADSRFSADKQFLDLFHHAVMDPLSCALDLPLMGKDLLTGLGLEHNPCYAAERIMRDFYQLFALYRQQHPKQSPMQQLFIFLAVARQSLECGFNETHQVLESMNMLHVAYHDLVSAKEQVTVALINFGQPPVQKET